MTVRRILQPFYFEFISKPRPPNTSYYFSSKSCINAVLNTCYNKRRTISLNSPKANHCACFRGTNLILNDNSSRFNFQVQYRSFSVGSNFKAYETNNWTWKETRFNGLTLDLGVILQNPDKKQFLKELEEYLDKWKSDGKSGIFIKIPLKHSWSASYLGSLGFTCHHAKNDYIMMTKWLPEEKENKIPHYAFHTVGVSGLVLNEETREALVVQDRGKIMKWKFPGGFAEPNEDIGDTAVREIREETGVESEFQSLLTFRQQHGMRFNMSDLYFICRLHPLTFDIKLCETEIAKCEWLPLEYLLDCEDSTPLTKRVTAMAIKGLEEGFQEVDIVPEQMTSWVPPYDKTFKVYHRPIEK